MRIVTFREMPRGQHTSSVYGLAICKRIQPNTSNGPSVPGNLPTHTHILKSTLFYDLSFKCTVSWYLIFSNLKVVNNPHASDLLFPSWQLISQNMFAVLHMLSTFEMLAEAE